MRPRCSTMNRRLDPSFAFVRRTGSARPDISGSRLMREFCASSSPANQTRRMIKNVVAGGGPLTVSPRLLQRRTIVARQQNSAYYLDRNASLLHKFVVKAFQAVGRSLRLLII